MSVNESSKQSGGGGQKLVGTYVRNVIVKTGTIRYVSMSVPIFIVIYGEVFWRL